MVDTAIYLMDAGELAEHLGQHLEQHGWDGPAEDAFELLVTRYQAGTHYRTRFECALILREELSYFAPENAVGVHPSLITDLAKKVA